MTSNIEWQRRCDESLRYSKARRAHVRDAGERRHAYLMAAFVWIVLIAVVVVVAINYW